MRTIRLFQVLDYLRSRSRPVSAARMADHLGVSVRTLYRDIATLQEMGAPIRGAGGLGYQLEKGYFLPPLHFDADELDAIVLGLRLAAKRGDPDLAVAADRVLGKLAASGEEVASDLDRPLLAVGTRRDAGSADRIAELRLAVRERRLIRITYRDEGDVITDRAVRPLGLTAFESVWLLTGWCLMRSDFRNFRPDRLQSLMVSDERFPVEAGKEFRDYLRLL